MPPAPGLHAQATIRCIKHMQLASFEIFMVAAISFTNCSDGAEPGGARLMEELEGEEEGFSCFIATCMRCPQDRQRSDRAHRYSAGNVPNA